MERGSQQVDTPRTQHRKELCQHRLAYFNGTTPTACLNENSKSKALKKRGNYASVEPSGAKINTSSTKPVRLNLSTVSRTTDQEDLKSQIESNLLLQHMKQDPRVQKGLTNGGRATVSNGISEQNWLSNEYHKKSDNVTTQSKRSPALYHNGSVTQNLTKNKQKTQPSQHDDLPHTTVNTFHCEMPDSQSANTIRSDLKTDEFHFLMNSAGVKKADSCTTEDFSCKLRLEGSSRNSVKNTSCTNEVGNVIDRSSTDKHSTPRLRSKERLRNQRDCLREQSLSPSRKSSVSDWTVSNLTIDDDLTDITELGLSTHRPSDLSSRAAVLDTKDEGILGRRELDNEQTAGRSHGDVFESGKNFECRINGENNSHFYARNISTSETVDTSDVDFSNNDKDVESTIPAKTSINRDHLREVLGMEKYNRFIKNFDDCDDESIITDVADAMHRISWMEHNSSQVHQNDHQYDEDYDDYLELKTHRPVDDISSYHSQSNPYLQFDSKWPTDSTQVDSHNLNVQPVKCAFSINQIYNVAQSFSGSDMINHRQEQLLNGHCSDMINHGQDQLLNGHCSSNQHDLTDTIISDVNSSLTSRELRTLRQKPFGPIPQRTREISPHTMSKPMDNSPRIVSISEQLDGKGPVPGKNFSSEEKTRKEHQSHQSSLPSESIQRYLMSMQMSLPEPIAHLDVVHREDAADLRVFPVAEESSKLACATVDDDHGDTSSSLATSKLLRPISEYNDEKNYGHDPEIELGHSEFDEVKHKVKLVAHNENSNGECSSIPEKVHTDNLKSRRSEQKSDHIIHKSEEFFRNDDLYTRVTSVVSEDGATGLTERMEKLGINFDFLKGTAPGPNYIVDKVIPVNIVLDSDSEDAGLSKPAVSSGLPKASTSKNKKRDKGDTNMVKVCPECAGINRPYMDWCTDCGEVLIGVHTVPSNLKRTERCKVKAWLREEASMHAAHKTEHCNNNSKPGLRQSKDSDVRDSDSFQYKDCIKPSDSMSNQLRTELSLNVRGSSSSLGSASRPVISDPSEAFQFVYEESVVPTSSLPAALRAELSLNLRESMDSQDAEKHSEMDNNRSSNAWVQSRQKEQNSTHKKAKNKHHSQVAAQAEGNQADCSPPLCHNGSSPILHHHGSLPPEIEPQVAAEVIMNNKSDQKQQPHLVQDPEANGEDYQEFVSRLRNDSRFKPSQSKDGPKKSLTNTDGRHRPKSAGSKSSFFFSVKGQVRQSMEKDAYPQRWATSSQDWSSSSHPIRSYDRPSSAHVSRAAAAIQANRGHHMLDDVTRAARHRPHSAGKIKSNPGSGSLQSLDAAPGPSRPGGERSGEGNRTNKSNSQVASVSRSMPQSKALSAMEEMGKYMALAHGYTSKLYEKDDIVHHVKRPGHGNSLAPDEIIQMSPRIQHGELSMMLCLPEELLIYILTYVSHADLMRCAAVCTHFKRIALDPCLWKKIVLKKRTLTDDWLIEIGSKKPLSLTMMQCTGEKVTTNGVRELFRQCGDQLQELNFTGCQGGYLTGGRLLLHVTNRCRFLTHVDASWSNIDDCGLMALADSCHNLESLCVNGCPTIGDEAIRALVIKHGLYLKTLEMFGCFNLTERACISITTHCKGLLTLNMGQCWKIPDVNLCHLTASLGLVENLDLRGCKQMTDACVQNIVRNCPHLVTLAVANCPNLTDVSLVHISSMANNIKSLDVCGCKKLTNTGIKALASTCQSLEYLDISTTGVTHKGVSSLANYCNRHLEVLKVNFCKQITLACLVKLARHCRRLKKLYLYGLTGIRDTSELLRLNTQLWIEM